MPTLLKRIACEEDGGAYTLSYVMVVPFVMLFMCLVIESTLMLSAKLGTVYSAYAGARVASVWSSATSWDQAEARIESAAIQSFVPFASGSAGKMDETGDVDPDRFYQAYADYVDDPTSKAYVRKKFRNAHSSLTVTTDGPPTNWNSDITVTVKYDFPFRVPGIARLLGERGSDGDYYFPLTSRITLQNEGPQNESQELGIGYGTLE